MKFVNLTPHDVLLNNGTVYEKSGTVARISSTYTDFDENGICHVKFGKITGLPESQDGVIYIVSGMVASAAKNRMDIVSPATGHKDCIRNEQGQIVSVPGFVRN